MANTHFLSQRTCVRDMSTLGNLYAIHGYRTKRIIRWEAFPSPFPAKKKAKNEKHAAVSEYLHYPSRHLCNYTLYPIYNTAKRLNGATGSVPSAATSHPTFQAYRHPNSEFIFFFSNPPQLFFTRLATLYSISNNKNRVLNAGYIHIAFYRRFMHGQPSAHDDLFLITFSNSRTAAPMATKIGTRSSLHR